jgi:transmembrane sensor
MSEESQLPRPIGRVLADEADERHIAHLWRGIRARRERPSSRPRAIAAGIALAATASIAFFFLLRSENAGPLRSRQGAAIGTRMRDARAIELDDGSRIDLARGGAIEVLENGSDRFALQLRGHARFEVEPGGPRRWTIETPLATVEVVGTVFEVRSDPDRVTVSVSRGAVLVRGERVPDRARRVRAGQSIDIEAEPRLAAALEAAPQAPAPAPIEVAPEAPPVEDEALRSREMERLLDQADAARAEGRIEDAIELLGRVSRSGDRAHAGVASFTRARIELEAGRTDDAIRDLRRASSGALPRALDEEARALLVGAYLRAGRREDALRAQAAYLERYPNGARADEIAARLGTP